MKRLFWLSLMVFSIMLVAAAPGLPPTPDPYPGPTSYPGPTTSTPAPSPTPAPTRTPVPPGTPVCSPCTPTAVTIARAEARVAAAPSPLLGLFVAAAFLAVMFRQRNR